MLVPHDGSRGKSSHLTAWAQAEIASDHGGTRVGHCGTRQNREIGGQSQVWLGGRAGTERRDE